jgi:single-strand DNA-binding protein
MVNRVTLVGGLTRDAETFNTARGTVARMRLATSTYWRDAEGNRHEATEYHNLVAFNRLAEICAQYCMKGRRIYTEGRLRTREFEGSDGLRRTATEVVIETMRLLDRREEEKGAEFATGSLLAGTALHDTAHDTVHGPTDEEGAEQDPAPDGSHEDAAALALSGAGGH